MSHRGHFWRRKTELQRTFAFLERSQRRERRFKRVIFLTTLLTVVAIATGSPEGAVRGPFTLVERPPRSPTCAGPSNPPFRD